MLILRSHMRGWLIRSRSRLEILFMRSSDLHLYLFRTRVWAGKPIRWWPGFFKGVRFLTFFGPGRGRSGSREAIMGRIISPPELEFCQEGALIFWHVGNVCPSCPLVGLYSIFWNCFGGYILFCILFCIFNFLRLAGCGLTVMYTITIFFSFYTFYYHT